MPTYIVVLVDVEDAEKYQEYGRRGTSRASWRTTAESSS